MATTERRFLADQSGVVALTGLAMAVFMTAVLYYEIGVGDAITFHEQLQDASDATGFASAIYHAKGMNMIALVNIIMSAVLAVIVVLRVVGAICGIVGGIAAAICWFTGFTCPIAGGLEDVSSWCEETATEWDPDVREALQALNTVSTAIAAGMPWVAAVKSATVGPIYYPQVTSNVGGETIAVSVSLVPDLSWIPISSSKSDEDSEEGSKVENKRWGLPVMEGEYDELCKHAIVFVPLLVEDVVAYVLSGFKASANPPSWWGWANSFFSNALGSFPEYFCDSKAISGEAISDQIADQAKTVCGHQSDAFDKCNKQQTPTADGGLPPVDPAHDPCSAGVGGLVTAAKKKDSANPKFDDDACKKDETKKLTPTTSALQQEQESALPKAIYSYAANGNDYMAIWSFGWGDFGDGEGRGVSLASWDGPAAANGGTIHMISKAEFFFDVGNPCVEGGSEATKASWTLCKSHWNQPFWGSYAADTLWNPRWRARMRRVSPPMFPVGQFAISKLTDLAQGALKGKAASATADAGVAGTLGQGGADYLIDFITSFMQIAGGEADSNIAGQLEKAGGYEH